MSKKNKHSRLIALPLLMASFHVFACPCAHQLNLLNNDINAFKSTDVGTATAGINADKRRSQYEAEANAAGIKQRLAADEARMLEHARDALSPQNTSGMLPIAATSFASSQDRFYRECMARGMSNIIGSGRLGGGGGGKSPSVGANYLDPASMLDQRAAKRAGISVNQGPVDALQHAAFNAAVYQETGGTVLSSDFIDELPKNKINGIDPVEIMNKYFGILLGLRELTPPPSSVMGTPAEKVWLDAERKANAEASLSTRIFSHHATDRYNESKTKASITALSSNKSYQGPILARLEKDIKESEDSATVYGDAHLNRSLNLARIESPPWFAEVVGNSNNDGLILREMLVIQAQGLRNQQVMIESLSDIKLLLAAQASRDSALRAKEKQRDILTSISGN